MQQSEDSSSAVFVIVWLCLALSGAVLIYQVCVVIAWFSRAGEHCLVYQNKHLCKVKHLQNCIEVEPYHTQTLAIADSYFRRVGVDNKLILKDKAARSLRKGPPRISQRLSSGMFAVLLMSNLCEQVLDPDRDF